MSHARVISPPSGWHDIRRARRDQGLSVTELAQAAGVAGSVVRRAERGIEPREGNAKALADFFGVTVSDLWPEPNENGPAALDKPGSMTDVHQEDDSAPER